MNVRIEFFEYLNYFHFTIPLTLLFGYGLYKVIKWKLSEPIKEKDFSNNSSSNSSLSNEDDDFKLVLVVRNELKMGKGKVAAQCAHSAVAAYKQARNHPEVLKAWESNGQTKITLKCETEMELLSLHQSAKSVGLISNVVCDAGQTQVAPGSKTVCGIGPGPSTIIDQITRHLKLY